VRRDVLQHLLEFRDTLGQLGARRRLATVGDRGLALCQVVLDLRVGRALVGRNAVEAELVAVLDARPGRTG